MIDQRTESLLLGIELMISEVRNSIETGGHNRTVISDLISIHIHLNRMTGLCRDTNFVQLELDNK